MPIEPDPARPGPPPLAEWKPDTRTRVNIFVDLRHTNVPRLPGEKHREGNIVLAEVAVADVRKVVERKGVGHGLSGRAAEVLAALPGNHR